jgi:sirohydrochlorin ferrochelatase
MARHDQVARVIGEVDRRAGDRDDAHALRVISGIGGSNPVGRARKIPQ